MLIKFLLGWLIASLVFSLFLPYPTWLWGGAVAGAIVAVFA